MDEHLKKNISLVFGSFRPTPSHHLVWAVDVWHRFLVTPSEIIDNLYDHTMLKVKSSGGLGAFFAAYDRLKPIQARHIVGRSEE